MERFETHYDKATLARISTSLRAFVSAGLVLMLGAFVYYALTLSHLDMFIHIAVIATVLISGVFALRVTETRVKRFHRYSDSSAPAIVLDRRGVWVHERTGGGPIPWGALAKVEEIGSGKNRAIRVHTNPRAGKVAKPVVIPGGLYDADIADIAEALNEFKDIFDRS